MNEVLVRGTAWLAIGLYVAGECVAARSRNARLAHRLQTAGLVVFIGHVLSAFHFEHQWSHRHAYLDTATQTAAVTGWNWGGGLYVNYAFGLVWGYHCARRNRDGGQTDWSTRLVRAFFLLMIFNGAFVFVHGPMRWIGLALSLALVVAWFRPRLLSLDGNRRDAVEDRRSVE